MLSVEDAARPMLSSAMPKPLSHAITAKMSSPSQLVENARSLKEALSKLSTDLFIPILFVIN